MALFPNYSTKIIIWFVVWQSLQYFSYEFGSLHRSYRNESVQKNQIQVYYAIENLNGQLSE